MNREEFERFQEAIQWTVDEAEMPEDVRSGMKHRQDTWFKGKRMQGAPIIDGRGVYYLQRFAPLLVSCKSSGCLAGNGVIAAGDTMLANMEEVDQHPDKKKFHADECMDKDGNIRTIEKRAAELFGLTNMEAEQMFSSGNSVEHLEEIGGDIAADYGFTLNIQHGKVYV